MARADLTVLAPTRTAVNETLTKLRTATGHQFANDGKVWFRVSNTNSSTGTVIISVAQLVDGDLSVTSRTITLAATGETGAIKYIGPFPTSAYNQSGALVYIDPGTDNKVDITVMRRT